MPGEIYSVAIDSDYFDLAANCFVITGGAIKVTLGMETPYLQEELQKLEKVRQFLVDHDVRDQTDFEYLEI